MRVPGLASRFPNLPFSAFKFFLLFVLLCLAAGSVTAGNSTQQTWQQFNQHYSELLGRYWRPAVSIHGIETTVFDYTRMSADAKKPGSLFEKITSILRKTRPPGAENANAFKAFWINAYNFGAMRLVVENYPVDSITSFKVSLLKHPWSKKALNIGGKNYSLSQIEKDILLNESDDTRVVFAVSCAAVSCPDRTDEAFHASMLDDQLNTMLRTFLKNPRKGASLNRREQKLTLSWIFDKDRHLFESHPGGLRGFVADYLEEDDQWIRNSDVDVSFFEHDWTLNDTAQSDSGH